jgi:hypothetical protein
VRGEGGGGGNFRRGHDRAGKIDKELIKYGCFVSGCPATFPGRRLSAGRRDFQPFAFP